MFDGLRKLRTLWLQDNQITEMPVLNSTTMTVLNMANNPLGELPVDALHHLPQLEECNFHATGLTAISTGKSRHYFTCGASQ